MTTGTFVRSLLIFCLAGTLVSVRLPATILAQSVQANAAATGWDDRFGFVGVEGRITTVAVAPSGEIYAGGDFTKAGGVAVQHIARWDGRSWHPLGEGLNGIPRQIVATEDSVYVVGDFTTASGVTATQIARWDGAAWSTVGDGSGPIDDYFGSPQTGKFYALAISGGNLYVGGDFTSVDGVEANNVAQWNGTSWSALGRGMGRLDWDNNFTTEGEVLTLVVDGQTLYAGGNFVLAGEATANSVAQWDGATWSALAGGVTRLNGNGNPESGIVKALALHNGSLYAGGWFDHAGGTAANHIATWNGNAWSALGAGVREEEFASYPPVNALAFIGDALYVGGRFVGAGNQTIGLVARWQNNSWSAVGEGISNDGYDEVLTLAPTPEGDLYMGGAFRIAGGQRVDNIAHWDGNTWSAFGRGLARHEHGDSPATPYAIGVDEAGRVYVGGEFVIAGGVKVSNLALWADGHWQDIGGANGRVRDLVVAGDDLYIAGEFTQAGGIGANHVARWNRASGQWSSLGSGINDTVYALAYQDGILYAGGAFSAAGTTTAHDVAYWDGAAWHPFGTQARIFEVGDRGGEVGTYVNDLVVSGDRIFVAGHFQTIQYGTNTADLSSFTVVHNVVEWSRADDEWYWLGDQAQRGVTNGGYSGFGTDAYALALVGDVLYVGGVFNQAGGQAASNLARWDRASERWLSLNASLGGPDSPEIRALAALGSHLFVGGKFTSAGNTAARFVAHLNTQTDSWSTLGDGLKWYNDRYTGVTSITASPQGVYVGGDFDQAGGHSAPGFAFWQETLNNANVAADAGGTVTGAGGIRVTFAPGAVAEDSLVTLAALPGPTSPLPNDQRALYAFQATAATMSGQPVTQFAKPYTLQAPYTDAQLAAAGITDLTTLNLAFWNGTAWTPLLPCAGCSIDTANKVITVVANHFTDFALVGQVSPDVQPQQKVFLPLVTR